jgi:hypothetical protein
MKDTWLKVATGLAIACAIQAFNTHKALADNIAVTGLPQIAAPASWPDASRAPGSWNWKWGEPRRVTVNQLSLYFRSLAASTTPAALANWLMQWQPSMSRVYFSANRIVLAGLDAKGHWLANVSGGASGAQATLSWLPFQSVPVETSAQVGADVLSELDVLGARQHVQSQVEGGRPGFVAVFGPAGQTLPPLRQLAQNLRDHGWSLVQVGPAGRLVAETRGQVLQVNVYPTSAGSAFHVVWQGSPRNSAIGSMAPMRSSWRAPANQPMGSK